jgi:hypothetical protein
MRTTKKARFLHSSLLCDLHWRRQTVASSRIRSKKIAAIRLSRVVANEDRRPSLVVSYQQPRCLQRAHIWDLAEEALGMRVQAMCRGQNLCMLRTRQFSTRNPFLLLIIIETSISNTAEWTALRAM